MPSISVGIHWHHVLPLAYLNVHQHPLATKIHQPSLTIVLLLCHKNNMLCQKTCLTIHLQWKGLPRHISHKEPHGAERDPRRAQATEPTDGQSAHHKPPPQFGKKCKKTRTCARFVPEDTKSEIWYPFVEVLAVCWLYILCWDELRAGVEVFCMFHLNKAAHIPLSPAFMD